MSLINDALKRATQAQPPTPPADPAAPMQPVEPHGSVGLPVYFMPILLFVISGACYFLVQGWEVRRQTGLYPQPVTVHARETAPPTTKTGPDQESTSAPVNRDFALHDAPTPAPAPAVAAATPAATVGPAVNDEPPPLRLQGIFYRPSRPSAVVNSQTVYVGDSIAGGKVKAIGRNSVTLLVDGQTKVLTLR